MIRKEHYYPNWDEYEYSIANILGKTQPFSISADLFTRGFEVQVPDDVHLFSFPGGDLRSLFCREPGDPVEPGRNRLTIYLFFIYFPLTGYAFRQMKA